MTLEQIQEGIDAYKNVLGKLNSIPKVMAPAKKVIATAMLQSIKKFL